MKVTHLVIGSALESRLMFISSLFASPRAIEYHLNLNFLSKYYLLKIQISGSLSYRGRISRAGHANMWFQNGPELVQIKLSVYSHYRERERERERQRLGASVRILLFCFKRMWGNTAPVFWSCDTKSWLTGTDPDGKDWEQEEKGQVRWLDSIIDSMDMSLSKFRERVKYREAWHAAGHGAAKSQTQVRDWQQEVKYNWTPYKL